MMRHFDPCSRALQPCGISTCDFRVAHSGPELPEHSWPSTCPYEQRVQFWGVSFEQMVDIVHLNIC